MAHLSDRQRRDQLKGFAYFDTFEQVRTWTCHTVDRLQVSNTPLLERPAAPESSRQTASNVVLIHDYAGGYHDYEGVQGGTTPEEMYSCDYLQFVDTFVYFSHHLVSVPPPSWINACHRSGVKVLGTFLVESWEQPIQTLLEQDNDGRNWVASQLADMARWYGFDGWLINLETPCPPWAWNPDRLESFLRQLRREVGLRSKIIWYDALTPSDFVFYQNTLNEHNARFGLAAGSILTNYAWTPQLASAAVDYARSIGMSLVDVHFGIDVFAQNTQDRRWPRVTWPRQGGGGTGTGLGVRELARLGLSVGIFGPAWCFEHFRDAAKRDVERAVWEGKSLPLDLSCDCADPMQHTRVPYEDNPVRMYSKQYPFGSGRFFHAEFLPALLKEGDAWRAQLSAQSSLPMERSAAVVFLKSGSAKESVGSLSTRIDRESGHYLVQFEPNDTEKQPPVDGIALMNSPGEAGLQFLDLNVNVAGTSYYCLSITYCGHAVLDHHPGIGLGLNICGNHMSPNGHPRQVAIPFHRLFGHTKQQREIVKIILSPSQFHHVTDIQFLLTGSIESLTKLPQKTTLVDIVRVSLLPGPLPAEPIPTPILDNVSIAPRGSADLKHYRLSWTFREKPIMDPQHPEPSLSLSRDLVTGPFSHFEINIGGKHVGRAYALEYVLSEETVAQWRRTGVVQVQILGISFYGSLIADFRAEFPLPPEVVLVEDDWLLVNDVG